MRYEIKYAIKNIDTNVVHQVIRMHPAGFRKIHPDRVINNVYFDSPLIDTFYANVAGVSERKKFRLRWYGQKMDLLEKPVFEIKIKENQLGRKIKKKLPAMPYQAINTVQNELIKDPALSKVLRPSLLNSYHRSYYGLRSGKFRITIDSKLSFGPVHPERPKLIYQDLPLIVIELKYDATNDEEVDWIRQYLPFRQTKSSKYALGISLIQ